MRENHPESVIDQAAHSHNGSDSVSQSNSDSQTDNQTMPPEKIALFEQRYKEGYDIPDDEYMQWLRKSHPEAAAEYPAFFTGNNDGSDLGYPSSLTHLLSYLPVASPVAILTSGSSLETGDDVTNDGATSKTVECDDGLSETNAADSNMFTKNTDLSKSTVAKSVSNYEYSSA